MKNQRNHARHHVGLILTLISLIGVAPLLLSPARRVSAQAGAPNWSFTGSLNTARVYHTATLLLNGKVLIAGGYNGADSNHPPLSLNSAELYDPATGIWSSTGSLNTARYGHTATRLQNGQVLVISGRNSNTSSGILSSAELYDPATGIWGLTGNLNTARFSYTATLLTNGKVLVAGGQICGQGCATSNSAELYDPATGIWSLTGNLNTARYFHTATLLPNGKVLIVGGTDGNANVNTAELYDPATGIWSFTGNLNVAFAATATLLQNGKVLVSGEFNCTSDEDCDTLELYDPVTETFSITAASGIFHTATLLTNGKVLNVFAEVNFAELYDPVTETFSGTANPNTGRYGYTTTLLLNGRVLVAAGGLYGGSSAILNTAELYDPGANPNQIDDVQFFVHQHYLDFLNRQPDADGLAFWTNEITLCGADQQCIEAKRINVSAAFFLSIEFQQTGYLVYRFYKASYGNLPSAPVPLRFSESLPDTQKIGQGVVVNQPGWEQLLENNKLSFFSGFVQRSRFASAYPTSLSPQQFVDQLFVNAEVAPSEADRSAAINEFGAAMTTSDVAARARALRRVAENSTLAQQEFNRAFVLMQYFGYLRRNPNDSPEATLDFQGYNFWLNKLNQFNGNFVQAEMVKAFLVSTEYRQRFGP